MNAVQEIKTIFIGTTPASSAAHEIKGSEWWRIFDCKFVAKRHNFLLIVSTWQFTDVQCAVYSVYRNPCKASIVILYPSATGLM